MIDRFERWVTLTHFFFYFQRQFLIKHERYTSNFYVHGIQGCGRSMRNSFIYLNNGLIKNHGSRRPAQRGRDTGIHCLVIAVKRRGNEVSTPRESNVWLTREGRFLIFSVKQRFVIGPDSDVFARHACIMGWQCFFPPFYFILFRIFLFRVLPLFSFIFSPSFLSPSFFIRYICFRMFGWFRR